MSLYNFFKKIPKETSTIVAETTPEETPNITEIERTEVVESLRRFEDKKVSQPRGKYRSWTPEEKLEIGKHAMQYGVGKTVKLLAVKYPGLKKQSVSDFKKLVVSAKATETSSPPKSLKNIKRGRKSLLPEEMMSKTIELVEALRLKGAPVTAGVVNSIAKGVVCANDRSILVENGGYLFLSRDWGRNVLYRMEKEGKKMCRRKGTTAKIPIAPGLLKEVKLKYQREIQSIQKRHNIPDDMILNFDQTPLSYVSSPGHTLHFKGASNVPLVGKGKKKQITGTFTVSKSGIFLPMQLIYEGKTERCHPQGIVFFFRFFSSSLT